MAVSQIPSAPHARAPRARASETPIAAVITRALVRVRPEDNVNSVVQLMTDRRVGCLPVVDERGRPVGIITKLDVVEQLAAAMRLMQEGTPLPSDLAARTAEDMMMPFALTLDETATVAHAASMMVLEDTHHVIVVDKRGVLAGVVSSKDIVRWVAGQDTSDTSAG